MTRAEAERALSCLAAEDLTAEEAAALREWLERDEALAARAEALTATRTRVSDALFDRAPRGLLDLVEAPEPSLVREPRPPAWRVWVLLAVLVLGLLGTAGWWLFRGDDLVERSLSAHRLVEAPGVWLDPTDGDGLTAAFDLNQVPRPLRTVPDLGSLELRARGVLVLWGDPPGTAVIYEDPSGSRLSWQRWAGVPTPDLGRTEVIGGVQVSHGTAGDDAMAAYTTNGVLHVAVTDASETELLDLVRKLLTTAR